MEKIIAREVAPQHANFNYYFDGDMFTDAAGENCAIYIPGSRHTTGYNADEYQSIVDRAQQIIDEYDDGDGINGRWNQYTSLAELLIENGVLNSRHNTKKIKQFKSWLKYADTSDTDSIAEYLTITTGATWEARAFCGYSQGDYCEVVYCTDRHNEAAITEIGKMWLGCGSEFSIDDCYGYFVIDEIRWTEDERLINVLADCAGCDPAALEVYLYDGEHTVADYRLLTA